jgi:hypothetical protein
MARSTPYYDDEPKGGGGAAPAGGGGGRSAGNVKREVIDTTKGSKSEKEATARDKELAASRREEALANAKTEGNKTEYPYVEPTGRGTVAKPRKEKPSMFEMTDAQRNALTPAQLRKYGSDASFKNGGSVSSASRRADGCATKGKTKGRYI